MPTNVTSTKQPTSELVTGVTTPVDNILNDLYMYLDAYDRRSYSLPKWFPIEARIFWNR